MQLVRLKSNKAFQEIFSKGTKVVTPFFVIYKLQTSISEQVHYGVIASKKFLRTAVERNYAKRLLRNMINSIDGKRGLDIILIARKKIIKTKFSYLCEQLEGCL